MRILILFLSIAILSGSLFGQENQKKKRKKKDSIVLGWKSKGMLEALFSRTLKIVF